MRGKFEKKRTAKGKLRYALLAFIFLGVFAVSFFHIVYGSRLHAATEEILTRGVVDHLEQLPTTKRTKNPSAELGTKENPFLVLEIVPYEEYAEFGYHIGGCEPVDVENMFGRGAMSTIATKNTATITNRGTNYFFPDEPEGNQENYDNELGIYNWNYGAKFQGYYEKVEKGTGSFCQKEDGSIEKKDGGDIIWHTVNDFEKAEYAGEKFADDTGKLLEKVGERIYTTRENTQEDTVRITYNYFTYKNNENFLRNSLLKDKLKGLSQNQAEKLVEDYSIVIKTITPKELNENPDWVTYTNLFSIAPQPHDTQLPNLWKEYRRLQTHTPNTGEYVKNFVGEGRDISWNVAEKIFKRVTDKENYAVMIMDNNAYEKSYLMGSVKENVSFDILDWNLKPTGHTYDNTFGSNNNVYKLSIMLLCMDSDLFRTLYFDEQNPVIKNGKNTLQKGDAAEYWSSYSFLLSDPNGDAWEYNPYAYWESEQSWENYGTTGNITEGENKTWVKDHVYTYPGNNSLTSDFLVDGAASTNKKFDEFQDYIDEKYPDENHKPSPSDAIRYILGGDGNGAVDDTVKGTLNILDIEPCVDLKKCENPDSCETCKNLESQYHYNYTLTENYIRLMLPKFKGKINITHMTTAEFIGNADDLNSTYNMIYLGLDYGAYNTAEKSIEVQKETGGTTWIKKVLPNWNDDSMDGKIYFHTGDVMTSAEYVNSKGRSRSVQYLWSTATNSVVNSKELRFPGNDITKLKKKELENFLEAGYPVVSVPYLYNTEKVLIDQNSNICKLIKDKKGEGVYSASDASGIIEAITVIQPEVSFNTLPALYNGETNDKDKIEDPNYLPKNSAGQSKLEFAFEVKDIQNDKYAFRIYVDQNQDGKFSAEEVYYKSSSFLANGGVQKYTCKLSSLLVGVVQWKIEVYNVANENIHFVEIGCSAARNTTGNKKVVNVLQIMPKPDSQSYGGKLNLETNELFKKYYKSLEDYEINITAVSLEEFTGWFQNNNENKKFSFDNSREVSYEKDNPNPVNYTTTLKSKLKEYNMFIFGFGDTYGGQNISNEYGAVDFIKYFIAEGKSVLFTHDMTSMHNKNAVDFGYSVNTLMRDVMGMNRYQAVSGNLSEKERMKLIEYQKERSYDTVFKSTSQKVENPVELEQKQGFTYYAMKRLGWTDTNMSASQKMPYKYMIYDPAGEAICDNGSCKTTGFNNNNDFSTQVGRINSGQITEYPFKISKKFTIAKTHGQWYQLNMEDPEVTVWYSLIDDKIHSKCDEKDKSGNIISSNGEGTAVTYGVSPYDAANNYYIYSKGNVFYSGVGHSEVTGDMEAKLFINTMIAAYRASYEPPMVEILNEEAELTDTTDITYQVSIAQEYDADIVGINGENKVLTEEFKKEDMVKVKFSPVELNAISTKLDCSLYYLDTTTGEEKRLYIDTIYDGETDEKIEAKDHLFEDVKNMHTYYFYYPKKYLNEWTDEYDKEHSPCWQMQFEIKNNKVKEPGYTTLNMVVQQLFQLD